MALKGKKILVTGADGFIGSHLTEQLVKAGASVRAFVYYNSFNSWGWLDQSPEHIKKEIDIFAGDIRDPNGVRDAVKGQEVVLHLASLIAIPFSYHSPDTYVDTNIKGTLNVLQAVRDSGVEKMVHTSTSEVYGTAQYVPIDEAHPLVGQSPYSATKIAADQLAVSFYRSFDTPVGIIRPFNTYGPRQSARAVIPTIIMQVLSGVKKIKLGSLHPTRDFNYVLDTVAGFMKAAETTSVDWYGEVINLGSNFEVSIGDTAQLIAEAAGTTLEIEVEDDRLRPEKSEVERLWAENAKAKRLLDWEPAYGGRAGFKRGLKETIDWFARPENLAGYKVDIYNK
ncbi:NAD-dependent 4,6-dehydratase LegB [Thalassobacillus hwangdonensis]|uniref:NAD-dependent 4,6-dehydratase LegB n=1 Tax=Thalassobacillus hwangdonensis TaxID=546108 RepID=A0ABW3L3S3_9BACI